jgi:hypothetical protein
VWSDDNVYGSIVRAMLALHTRHIATDLVDTLVLAMVSFPAVADNSGRNGGVDDMPCTGISWWRLDGL